MRASSCCATPTTSRRPSPSASSTRGWSSSRPSLPDPLVTNDVALAAARLRDGGLVAIPTETVYGLAADASSPAAVARIFEVKGRPADHPLIVHLLPPWLPEWAAAVPP